MTKRTNLKTRIRAFALILLAAGCHTAAAALPPLPQPITSFGAAIEGEWLYVYGGNAGKAHEFHRESIKGDFFRVKLPDGSQWETLPAGAPLLGSPMVVHDGWIYRIGGMEARNAQGEKNNLHSTRGVARYRPGSDKWEKLPDLPDTRSSHDVAILNDILHIGGGWKLDGNKGDDDRGEWQGTMWSLDLRQPETGWKTTAQPFKRRALAVVAHGDRLWFLGGMDENDEPSLAVDWHDPKTGEWGKGPPLPKSPMAGFGMAACNAGGRLLTNQLSGKIHALNAERDGWEEVTSLNQPRFFHRLLPTPDGRLVAVGGSNRKGQIDEPELILLNHAGENKPAAESVSTGDWPQWRGVNRDGKSSEEGWVKAWPEGGPALLWRAQVGVGMSSCVVVGDRVFTQGSDGKETDSVIALDAATGKELWRHSFPCPATVHEMPIVPAGPGATPTVVGEKIYVTSRGGDLICLNVKDGAVLWQKHLVTDLGGRRPVYGYAQSPLVDNGRVFIDAGAPTGTAGSTLALDAATGEVIWRGSSGEAGYSSARIFERDGQRYVAMFKGEAMEVFDPQDGRVLWSHRTTARDFSNAATPTLVDHQVLASNTGTDLAALLNWDTAAEANVRPTWTHKQFALLFNSAIPYEGALFGFNEKRRGHHEFTCIDQVTGETKWVSNEVPTGTFILADQHWLFLTRDGEVVVAPASTTGCSPVARFQAVPGKSYASPTLANGRLFVRNNAGEIAAFDLKPQDR
ncbi:MAG: PQQ-binding-like beta-propeller repeat protein [Chthoniobacteraceae bacterium]